MPFNRTKQAKAHGRAFKAIKCNLNDFIIINLLKCVTLHRKDLLEVSLFLRIPSVWQGDKLGIQYLLCIL